MNKTREEIREEMLIGLSSSLGINITDEGSIALAIVDALVDEVYNLYQEVGYMRQQAYLSTSSNSYVDMIAKLVDTEREDFESDDNLKLRANNSVYRHAGGNIIAIEEVARSISGVAKVDYRPYGHGTGSFILFVYPQAHENQYRLLERVKEALSEVVSEGIYYEVRVPEELAVNLTLLTQFKEDTTPSERNILRSQMERSLRRYLNNLEMNDILYINEIVSTAMSTSEKVLDVQIIEYQVGGVNRPLSNTYPANEERFMAGNIQIN